MSAYDKPLPIPDAESAEFWKAARRHELLIQRCKSCKEHIFYPRALCPNCLSLDLEWVRASGKGRLYSYTVVRQAPRPAFEKDLPYVVAIVQLDEGPRLMSNLVGCKLEDIKVNMPVTVVFEDATSDVSLPKFKPELLP